MLKRIEVVLFSFSLMFLFSICFAEKKFTLYGFKIGQSIEVLTNDYGKPNQIVDFDDGFKAYVYKFKGHNAIFESDSTRPDMIFAIQIQGITNPKYHGLDGVNLGDNIDQAIKVLGEPNKKQIAKDESSGKEIPDTYYYDYFDTGNYSIEVTSNKITSIKINYNGPNTNITDLSVVFDKFLSSIKSKSYDQVASLLTGTTEFYYKKVFKLEKSALNFILKNKAVNNILFNSKTGLISIDKSDVKSTSMRIMDSGLTGMVYKIEKGNNKFEIVFIKTFEGWVVLYLDKL